MRKIQNPFEIATTNITVSNPVVHGLFRGIDYSQHEAGELFPGCKILIEINAEGVTITQSLPTFADKKPLKVHYPVSHIKYGEHKGSGDKFRLSLFETPESEWPVRSLDLRELFKGDGTWQKGSVPPIALTMYGGGKYPGLLSGRFCRTRVVGIENVNDAQQALYQAQCLGREYEKDLREINMDMARYVLTQPGFVKEKCFLMGQACYGLSTGPVEPIKDRISILTTGLESRDYAIKMAVLESAGEGELESPLSVSMLEWFLLESGEGSESLRIAALEVARRLLSEAYDACLRRSFLGSEFGTSNIAGVHDVIHNTMQGVVTPPQYSVLKKVASQQGHLEYTDGHYDRLMHIFEQSLANVINAPQVKKICEEVIDEFSLSSKSTQLKVAV